MCKGASEASDGADPIFTANDGSNCEGARPESLDETRSLRLPLSRGLIRVGLDVPDGAEFVIERAVDLNQCAPPRPVSLYRRPLPSTNLRFISAVMGTAANHR
jgi:hypothetical protein